jgi:hypothetical protein
MEYNMGSHDSRQSGRNIREQPPRSINLFTRMAILLGGVIQQMGWAFFGFGMLFFWIFVMNSEARYLLAFDGKWVETNGVLKNIAPTGSTVNDRRIYAYSFTFISKSGMQEGICYDSYRSEYQKPNQTVHVEYKEGNNKRARIKGMSSSTFPSFVLFVVIFPLIGLGFLISGLISNLKALRLLRDGHFTRGKLINKEATGTRINNNIVFKFTFEFDTAGGMKHQTTCATHQTWKVEDEELEIILYDPSNPDHAVVYDAIPAAPEIDPQGHLESAPISSAGIFILPIISIVVNVILFYVFLIMGISI